MYITDSLGFVLVMHTVTHSHVSTIHPLRQSVTGIRMLTVFDPCGPSERTCDNSATFACSVNGNCGSEAAALAALLSSGSGSATTSTAPMSTSSNSAAIAAAAAATALLFSAPDTVPPVITLLGSGQPFVTGTGGSGIITTVVVGSVYIDPGATAIKVCMLCGMHSRPDLLACQIFRQDIKSFISYHSLLSCPFATPDPILSLSGPIQPSVASSGSDPQDCCDGGRGCPDDGPDPALAAVCHQLRRVRQCSASKQGPDDETACAGVICVWLPLSSKGLSIFAACLLIDGLIPLARLSVRSRRKSVPATPMGRCLAAMVGFVWETLPSLQHRQHHRSIPRPA